MMVGRVLRQPIQFCCKLLNGDDINKSQIIFYRDDAKKRKSAKNEILSDIRVFFCIYRPDKYANIHSISSLLFIFSKRLFKCGID